MPEKIQDNKEKTIVVAMSGGVDSSVVACMLKEQGYNIIGITLQLYDQGQMLAKKGACCAGQDIYDAKLVADKLGIPHYVLDYESKFKESVIDDFAESYIRGETPLPCVKCNQSVKFKDLLKFAKELKADALATGHYVQKIIRDGQNQLHKGEDQNKDQSYFLFATTKEQLDYLMFPLGGYSKEKTRELAIAAGLAVADKPDSQDICFVPGGNYREVIKKIRPDAEKKGRFIHVDGFDLGEHNGVINYTIGQRRGIGVAYGSPLYVIKIDSENCIVYLGPESALHKTRFIINNVNWLADNIDKKQVVSAKIRSTTKGVSSYIRFLDDENKEVSYDNFSKIEITLLEPEKAVTPGQACVLYDGNRVLGGGWITREIY